MFPFWGCGVPSEARGFCYTLLQSVTLYLLYMYYTGDRVVPVAESVLLEFNVLLQESDMFTSEELSWIHAALVKEAESFRRLALKYDGSTAAKTFEVLRSDRVKLAEKARAEFSKVESVVSKKL